MYGTLYLVYLINVLLSPMKLVWNNKSGLSYLNKMAYGEISFNITKDWNTVLKFLGVTAEDYGLEKKEYDLLDFAALVLSFKYTNLPYLFNYPTPSSSLIEFFLSDVRTTISSNLPNMGNTIIPNHIIRHNPLDYAYIIDKEFGMKGNLLRKLNRFEQHKKQVNRKFVKNKFNGNLVMSWVEELSPGKRLGDIMEAFMMFKSDNNRASFIQYLKNTKIQQIRWDFVLWYNTEIKHLDAEFKNIPY